MPDPHSRPDPRAAPSFLAAFQRPARVVAMVAQMLLGLALGVTLAVKFYMLVLGAQACTPDDASLANTIRCTATLTIVGHVVLAVAGFRLAAVMFQDRHRLLLDPLMVAQGGVLLLLLSALTPAAASWQLAATLVVLMRGIGAV